MFDQQGQRVTQQYNADRITLIGGDYRSAEQYRAALEFYSAMAHSFDVLIQARIDVRSRAHLERRTAIAGCFERANARVVEAHRRLAAVCDGSHPALQLSVELLRTGELAAHTFTRELGVQPYNSANPEHVSGMHGLRTWPTPDHQRRACDELLGRFRALL